MSYSLAVQNGDLVQQGSNLGVVWGIDKLKQDLQLWTTERYGGDRFHPELGTVLQDYIGDVISKNHVNRVHSEMMRVLDNYQRMQMHGFKINPRLYSMDELLESINDIVVKAHYDYISVSVSVSNAVKDTANLHVTQGV